MDCVDALTDLREQEKELTRQKLDNIIDHYDFRINQLEDGIKERESLLTLMKNQGREIKASDYTRQLLNTQGILDNLIKERDALKKEFEEAINNGYIEKESKEWFDYQSKLDNVNITIVDTQSKLIGLQDTVNTIKLTNLNWQLDELVDKASTISGFMNLHDAQDIDEQADAYKNLIDNGMEQIKNIEEQNKEYRKQQEGLDVLSDKYQELQSNIESNNQAIMNMKVSQENWNDAIIELKMDSLNKMRDRLSKINEQYQRQKDLQEALEDLEKAKSQRTQRVFVQDQGFVYQADQDEIRSAQEKLESVIEDQLLDRIDDLVDALDDLKKDSNIYDAEGNLLGTEYIIPQIGTLTDLLTGYYNKQDLTPSLDDFKRSAYEQIVSAASTNNSNTFSFGDINLSEVNDADTLAQVIVDQLPNALLQALYKK